MNGATIQHSTKFIVVNAAAQAEVSNIVAMDRTYAAEAVLDRDRLQSTLALLLTQQESRYATA